VCKSSEFWSHKYYILFRFAEAVAAVAEVVGAEVAEVGQVICVRQEVAGAEVELVAAGKEDFRLVCVNRQNFGLISIISCFALQRRWRRRRRLWRRIVEKGVGSGDCSSIIWPIRRHPTYILRNRIASKKQNIHLHDASYADLLCTPKLKQLYYLVE
jgi:hypothetical protein